MSFFTRKKSPDLAGAICKFSWKLYISLSRDQSANVFFSPFSIMTALSMTFAGARGNTAEQMSRVLEFSKMKDGDIQKAFQKLNQVLLSPNARHTLDLAFKLYLKQGFEVCQSFSQKTEKYYNSAVEVVDFERATEAARLSINQWVSDETNDKINNLIPNGGLDPLTRLVLVNAVYLKGKWLKEFDPTYTSTEQFHVSKSESIPVQMMYLNDSCPYFEDEKLKCQVLSLLYEGGQLSMVIVLPNTSRSLSELEADINGDVLYSWGKINRLVEVYIYLPRFQIEESCFLKRELSEIGMSDLFNPDKADLSGITEGRELFVSDVIHKTFVTVNEQGTEAGAATAPDFELLSASLFDPPTFRADHPFLFYIIDNKTNSILFLGRVVRPISEE